MNHNRIFVLGLDGMPYTLLNSKLICKYMPNFQKLCESGIAKRINSVYPTISSVAWTSYATGKGPGEHNIFGFVDRKPNPFNIVIPTAKDRMEDTIWCKLSRKGKRVNVINVPMTYPPEPVNGKMVSCFLCTDIEKSTYPKKFHKYLEDMGYIIDVDSWIVRESKEKFMNEVLKALKKRFELAFKLMTNDPWDFFQLNIMETDRVMHFFWDDITSENDMYGVMEFFKQLDFYTGELHHKLSGEDKLIIMSDHGFCRIKNEVQLNTWLEHEGFLKFQDSENRQLKNYSKDSICYSLPPGRIFINLEGREEKGTVSESQYYAIRAMLGEKLTALIDPITGEKIIDKVFYREELYKGNYLNKAADIILHPKKGNDLKSSTEPGEVFGRSILNGMHTYDDACIIGLNIDVSSVTTLEDITDIIMNEIQ